MIATRSEIEKSGFAVLVFEALPNATWISENKTMKGVRIGEERGTIVIRKRNYVYLHPEESDQFHVKGL